MWIKISNETSDVNRRYLEKLGVSTKRENDVTIGQFGSGSKFAPIAALRMGLRWVNVGEDQNGPFQMEYVSFEQDGLQVVGFDYGDEVRESSFTIDAGLLSWDNHFQIFREAFSNALDAYLEFGAKYDVSFVDEIVNEPGIFSVYLSDVPELREIVNNLDLYFPTHRTVLADIPGRGKILKPFGAHQNIYFKGVLVHSYDNENDTGTTMFDYEIPQLTLNEERRVRNVSDIQSRWAAMMAWIDEDNADIVRKMINMAEYNMTEWRQCSMWSVKCYQFHRVWGDVWMEIHGENAIPVSQEMMRFASHLKMRGYTPILCTSEFIAYVVNEHPDVKSIKDILGAEMDFNFVELDSFDQSVFDEALEVCEKHIDVSLISSFRFFKPSVHQKGLMGQADLKSDSVFLSYDLIGDFVKLVGTIVHEYHHIETRFEDTNVQFRHSADEMIARLLLENKRLRGLTV